MSRRRSAIEEREFEIAARRAAREFERRHGGDDDDDDDDDDDEATNSVDAVDKSCGNLGITPASPVRLAEQGDDVSTPQETVAPIFEDAPAVEIAKTAADHAGLADRRGADAVAQRLPAAPGSLAAAQPGAIPPGKLTDKSRDRLASLTELARPSAPATDPRLPYWIPGGVDFDSWPGDLKLAVANVINPCYEELVLRARAGLARCIGLSIVHLMWLEMLDHIKLARLGHDCEVRDPDDPLNLVNSAIDSLRDPNHDRHRILARHLTTVAHKLKACVILARLEEFKARTAGPSWFPSPLPGEAVFPPASGMTVFDPPA